MAAKATLFATNLLKLVLQAVAYANIADNAASSPFTNTYVSLHTASPGASGDQTTSETSYTSYARQAVARTSSGWSVASGVLAGGEHRLPGLDVWHADAHALRRRHGIERRGNALVVRT
jgi:hypothetical protein